MSRRTITTFSTPLLSEKFPSRKKLILIFRNMEKGFITVVVLGVLVLLTLAPGQWRERAINRQFNVWKKEAIGVANTLQKQLVLYPVPHEDFMQDPGDEEGINREHPCTVALIKRHDPSVFWVREGDHWTQNLTPTTQRYLTWAKIASQDRGLAWNPTPDLDPEAHLMPSIVIVDRDWIAIKRWPLGSDRLEQEFRIALGPQPKARIAVYRANTPRGPMPQPGSAFLPPNIQAWPDSDTSKWGVFWSYVIFGNNWEVTLLPWPETAKAWEKTIDREVWMVRMGSVFVGLCLAFGLWLRLAMLRREALRADRLASLTHSLKTPLALHKLRCDAIRLGRIDPKHNLEEWSRLGQDIEDLTHMIERSLATLQADSAQIDRTPIDASWLHNLAEDMEEAFLSAERPFETSFCPEAGLAHGQSLQSALRTLLENAYYHGQGKVSFHSKCVGKRILIWVQDEGPGLDEAALAALGQPFMRLRKEGQEGFTHQGQGLGLSLLIEMARQEGWGLHFISEPGSGLRVELEIPASKA